MLKKFMWNLKIAMAELMIILMLNLVKFQLKGLTILRSMIKILKLKYWIHTRTIIKLIIKNLIIWFWNII